jgi:hypothetical protein
MARKVLPVPWFPQANGPLRPVDLLRPLDGEAPGRKPASDLGPSSTERVTGIGPALSAWESVQFGLPR